MSRPGNHVVHRHGAAHQPRSVSGDPFEASVVAVAHRRQRRARWVTAAGLAVATGVTIAVLASAQGTPSGSSAGAATADPSQATVSSSSGQIGVSSADLGAQAIEPGPPVPAGTSGH